MEKEKITVTAVYDRDSKRYHVFPIAANFQKVTGVIYCPKGEDVPDEVTIELRTRNDTNRS